MLNYLREMDQLIRKYRITKSQFVSVHRSAKVNFRGIRLLQNARLEIEEGAIVEGTITAEREGAFVSIGRHSFVGCSMLVAAQSIKIGSDVLISWGCSIVDHNSHSVNFSLRKEDVREWYRGHKDWSNVVVQPVRVKDKAWIGFNSIILKGVTVGEGAVVGAGSVVTKDVPDYTIVAGNPARIIREIPVDER